MMKTLQTRLSLFILAALMLGACKSRKMTIKNPAVIVQNGSVVESSDDASVTKTDRGLMMTFNSDVLFPTNSSYLSDRAKTVLEEFVDLVKDYPQSNIQVDGHTDATGEDSYNLWLSEKRAESVKKFLVDHGISGTRIFTEGYGLTKPVATNKTPEGRQQNRRVEITILDR